jgi:hypothetical protein
MIELHTLKSLTMNRSLFAGFLLFSLILLLGLVPLRNESAVFHSPQELLYFRKLAAMSSPVDSGIIFPTASTCAGCHGFDPIGYAMVDFFGNDVNVFDDWKTSMMANSAKDPFWRAKISHEVYLHAAYSAEIETKCTSCHAPMGHYTAIYRGQEHYTIEDMLADTIGLDGVSCGSCHKISTDNLGKVFSGEIPFDTNRVIYGPYPMPFLGPMAEFVGFEPVYSPHLNDAGICAPCHTLLTEPFDLQGNPIGTTFIEQATYHEWLNSTYNEQNVACQTCHMPRLEEPVVISANYLFLEGRSPYGLHEMVGGNAHMLKLMRDNRQALGIDADPEDFEETIAATLRLLQLQTLDMNLLMEDFAEDTARFTLRLRNKAGHKFPSGYPSRRAFVEFIAVTSQGDTLFHSGKMDGQYGLPDEDGHFEPHYQVITSPQQVQIYEMIITDVEGNFTTILERAYSTVKDNRLPPQGFTTGHAAYDTTRIVGHALQDPDFNRENGQEGSGTDAVRYHIPLNGYEGYISVIANVYYQSLPPRWMAPMFEISTPEIDSFREMFDNSDKSPVHIGAAQLDDIFVMGTSRTNNAADGLIRVFPNPATEMVFISTENSIKVSHLKLFDSSGRLLLERKGPVEKIRLPAPGVFFLEIATDRGRVVRKVVRE